jgi:uncharacterized protein (TIGR02246 family)
MPRSLPPADVDCLRSLVQAYGAAWLEGEAETVLRLFSEDAVLLPHHGVEPVVGKAAMRAFWWPPGAPPTTVTRFELTPDDIGGDGDLGYIRGRFELAYEIVNNGALQAVTNAGTFIVLARRSGDAEWSMTHHMWDDPVAQVTT